MNILIVLNNLRVANGVATVIMNQYDELIKNNCKVDFLQFIEFDSPYVKKILGNGGKIYTINKNDKNIFKLKKILTNKKYDIIHINQLNEISVKIAFLSKVVGIKKIIYHSHNTKITASFKKRLLEKVSNYSFCILSNKLLACTKEAGIDSFGKRKFTILKNAIDVDKFEFDNNLRKKLRKELDIKSNEFVVGTVCRYCNQKNPMLMLDIISEVVKIHNDAKFLWVGSAPNENDEIVNQINEKIKKLDLSKNVLLVGSKSDVYKWYSVMDVFIMPSKWEGLGITYIEAQANSLPTFASDVVPKDTMVTDLIEYISLEKEPEYWAKRICTKKIRNESQKKVDKQNFINKGYDIKYYGDELYKIYINAMEKEN